MYPILCFVSHFLFWNTQSHTVKFWIMIRIRIRIRIRISVWNENDRMMDNERELR